MKKLFLGLACVAGVGAFFLGQKTPEQASDLTLENIEAVGLSASEAKCDASNDHPCKIYNDGKIVMEATGDASFITN